MKNYSQFFEKTTQSIRSYGLGAIVAVASLASLVSPAHAQNPPDENFVRSLIPAQSIMPIEPAPMQGWVYTIVDGQAIFFSNDRRFMLYDGQFIDLEKRERVEDSIMAGFNKRLLSQLNTEDLVKFTPANKQHSVIVFTDPNCGYCRKLHTELQDYLDAGIEIQYAATDAFGGESSNALLTSAWCSADRKSALDTIKTGGQLPTATCENNPAIEQMNMSRQLGIRGTPAIFSVESGMQLGGYLPAQNMLARLQAESR